MSHDVKSPIPGTFYRKPSPDEPPFKNVSDAVTKGDVIGLVEVMKSFHQIQSDADGVIASFPVDDGEPVMAGQVLVILE